MSNNRLIHDEEDALPPAADAAVRGMANAASEPAPAKGRGPYPGRRQVTAHIPRQLFLWLKAISAQTDKPMILLMEEALSEYVQRHAAQKKFGG